VSWFLGQSWLIIILSFLLGLLVGWGLWRRVWHKRYYTESEAITRVTSEHSTALAEKDGEISRLRAQLDRRGDESADDGPTAPAGAPTLAGAGASRAALATDESGTTEADTTAESAADQTSPDKTAEAPVIVDTAESVDLTDVAAPEVDVAAAAEGEGVDVDEVATPSVDVSDDATASAQVGGVGVTPAGAEQAEPVEKGDVVEQGEAGEESEPVAETPAEAEPATMVSADAAPDTSDAAVAASTDAAPGGDRSEGEGDDLERIEGVGPRIASALRAAGITTFRRLAESDVAELQSALEAAGLRFAPSLPTWARQSRLLADGDEDGFLALTEQLVGGRDIGRRA